MLLARIVGVVMAFGVCAWFVLGAVQASARADVEELIAAPGELEPAEADRVGRLIDRAGFLNPGVEDDLLRAQVLIDQGDLEGAAARLRDVVAREPDNIDAWSRLALVAVPLDPAEAARARAEVRRLAPPVPAP